MRRVVDERLVDLNNLRRRRGSSRLPPLPQGSSESSLGNESLNGPSSEGGGGGSSPNLKERRKEERRVRTRVSKRGRRERARV